MLKARRITMDARKRYLLLILAVCATLIVLFFRGTDEGSRWYGRQTQDLSHVNTDVILDCQIPKGRDRIFYSQSNEDWSLFNPYFGTPIICNGTFVELGALDGEFCSNTKFYEDTLGWSGVLIEANPNNYEKLRKKRPRSKKYLGAVCEQGKTNTTLMFRKTKKLTGLGGDKSQMTDEYFKKYISADNEEVTVPCRPLGSYLHDAGVRHVDLFSLDVEGAEYLILQTMDWQIPVHVFVIEMGHPHDEDIRALLREHGYFPSPYNIMNFCLPKRDCAINEVFVNPNYSYS